ncbi:hypothetical protein AC57_1819 [Escherichia coli 1-392-07_S3_C3]|nr:hypothetical protein AC57_1819 [Escherichia coli 1-392-07_S3_C3]
MLYDMSYTFLSIKNIQKKELKYTTLTSLCRSHKMMAGTKYIDKELGLLSILVDVVGVQQQGK